MNSSELPVNPFTCCSEPRAADHPATLDNSAGRSALAYRIGTHSTFKAAMQAALARQPALTGLTARTDDDPSIALLDAWASVLDVLSFYQERIANEGSLHTATERRSVLELSRAMGYELKSGVAASAALAFSIEELEGAPPVVTIDVGTQAQSIPGQDELPETFETIEKIEARGAWNALRPRLTWVQQLRISGGKLLRMDPDGVERTATQLYFAGTSTSLRAGDLLLTVLKISTQMTGTAVLMVKEVVANYSAEWTRVAVEALAVSEHATPPIVPERTKDPVLPGQNTRSASVPLNDATVRNLILGKGWSDSDLSAIAFLYGWSFKDLLIIIERLTKGMQLLAADEGVFALRTRTAFFGHNAPHYDSLPDTGDTVADDGSSPDTTLYPQSWDESDGWEIWKDSLTTAYYSSADAYLERTVPGLVKEGWAVFEVPNEDGADYSVFRIRDVRDTSIVGFTLTARAAALKLALVGGAAISPQDKSTHAHLKTRTSSAHVASEQLTLAELPIEDPLPAGATQIELHTMVSDLSAGRLVAVSGQRADAAGVVGAEILALSNVTHSGGFTTLHLGTGLVNSYVRSAVTLNANVARATHGRTSTEVLGSGDGSKVFQRFKLKQQPLTYVSAPTNSGSASTLEVRVNNLLWQEVPSLYECGPSERVYVTRMDDDGSATVIFGDGVTGARLPTGTENITATYRVGSGLAGSAAAGQISLLMTRSLGLRGVTNPVAAAGAADAESLDEARQSAPLTVLTMDRIVSRQDFADFARGFAGIAKAQASFLWTGEHQVVHLTVAGAGGASVDPVSDLYQNLSKAINAAAHTVQDLQLESYQPLLFNVAGRVLVDPRYSTPEVLAAATAALTAAFSFERRELGQAVLKSEVLAVIQDVDGVVAVDLDALYLSTQASALNVTLEAKRAILNGAVITPAELLTVHQAGISLVEMI